MQPCGVCGGIGIDPAGYCTQCRTYRGHPQQQSAVPAPPPAYPQSYELLSPSSGNPYPGPVSAEPYPGPTSGGAYGTQGPTSGGGYPPAPGTVYGGGPTSGAPYPGTGGAMSYPAGTYGAAGGYPGYAPPAAPPTRGRSSFVVPLLALSGVLVLLVVAIVVVVVVKSGSSGRGGNGGGTDPTGAALVDSCVVGDWEETSHDEGAPIEQIGEVRFHGRGAKLHLDADGTAVTDYGNGVTYTGTGTLASSGQNVTISLKVSGTIKFDYRTNNGAMSFTNTEANGTAVAIVNDQEVGTQPLEGDENPANYTCSGDEMKLTTSVATVEWQRKG